MISLVFHTIDSCSVVRISACNNHPRNSHDIELKPRRIQPRNHFRCTDQNLLSLMSADLTTRSLVLDMNRANLIFDKLLYQIANVMFPTVPGIPIRDYHRRIEFNRRILFALHRSHSHAVGSLHFILMQEGAHPGGAFFGNSIQGVIRQIRAGVLRIGAPR